MQTLRPDWKRWSVSTPVLLLAGALLVALLWGCSARSPGSDTAVRTPEVDGGGVGPTNDLIADRTPSPDAGSEAIEDAALPRLPPGVEFSGPWAAGAAVRTVNPQVGAVLGGYGLCQGSASLCRYAEGIHDDLLVQAAALADPASGEVVVFVSVDSVGLLRHDIDQIHAAVPAAFAERFGVHLEGPRVVVCASHSHCTPDTVGLYGPMDQEEREEEEYVGVVRAAILEAALDAFGNLGDAELRWGTGSALTHSDDVHHEDEEVFVLAASRPDGEPVFLITRWPVHPTGYSEHQNGVSADYMGPYRLRIGQQFGGPALFLNGPQGSVYADTPEPCNEADAFPDGWQDPDVGPAEHGAVACVGYQLADTALAALDAGQSMAASGIRFRHASFAFHPTNLLLSLLIQESPIPIEVVDVTDPEAMMQTHFSWVTVGDLDFLTTPGESFPSFAAHARSLMESRGVENTVVLGLAQAWLGYLMSEEQFGEEGLSYYRTLSPGETVEPAFLERLEELLDAEVSR